MQLIAINKLEKSYKLDVDFICYIINVNGYGELETVLKLIKKSDSFFADCLDSWRECLKIHNKCISDKDFDKFYINNYIRFDTAVRRKRNRQVNTVILNLLLKKIYGI